MPELFLAKQFDCRKREDMPVWLWIVNELLTTESTIEEEEDDEEVDDDEDDDE